MSLYNFIDSSERAGIRVAYRLKNLKEKMARQRNHLTYMIRCRNKKLIPRGMRVKLPVNSNRGNRIAERTGLAVLRERIKYVRRNKIVTMNEISTVEHELTTMVDHDTYKNILDWSSQKAEKVFVETKKKHLKKFADLEHEH